MHIPVLFDEVTAWLRPAPGMRILDATAGGGGHAEGLLKAGAQVLATDADGDAVARVSTRLSSWIRAGQAQVAQSWLDEAVAHAGAAGFLPLDGALADLGLSSFQLDMAERGFAFMKCGPLDMRFDRARGLSASAWLDQVDLGELTRVLRDYGNVPGASRVAEAIWRARPITETAQLRDLVDGLVRNRSSRIHPATLVFQALRIAVNDELGRLERALPALIDGLKPGGRLAVISFHSLEDRIVKNAFREAAREYTPQRGFGDAEAAKQAQVRLLTKMPVTPGAEEVAANPRARSAKLRVMERL